MENKQFWSVCYEHLEKAASHAGMSRSLEGWGHQCLPKCLVFTVVCTWSGEHEKRVLSGEVLRWLLFPESWKQVSSLRTSLWSMDVKLTFFSCRERTAEGCGRRGAVHWRWRGANPRRGCWLSLPATVNTENQLSGATRPYQLSILALASSGQISRESWAKVQGTLPTVLEVYHVST